MIIQGKFRAQTAQLINTVVIRSDRLSHSEVAMSMHASDPLPSDFQRTCCRWAIERERRHVVDQSARRRAHRRAGHRKRRGSAP